MSVLDRKIERAANRLRDLASQAAAEGGLKAKLAEPLAEDAAFLRKLKPSLIRARARGEAPTDGRPGHEPVAPAAPQLGRRSNPMRGRGGVNPLLVVGAAFAAGIVVAKVIDWRSHAHPRR